MAVDMGWTARLAPGLDRLVSYEREVNRIFSEGYAMALCCYDRRLFTAAELERLGAAHPGTARGGAGTDEEWTPLLRMRREGGVLTLSGEADATNQDALRVMVEDVVESARDAGGHAVIDVSALTFADLAAVRLLAGAVTAGSARLRGAGPWLTDVLALVGVHDPGEGSAR
ncbi:MEDS domain-containing protein [Thermocatellispora tengchongensis]|uniref:MEDS domain-containing protein n=1 Tax=Thermocatellispora tengchongensis TaxID=1073253 RepID=UPI00363ABBC8